ncbi:MAG TPA: NAD(P)H-dependent oxidoreductase [Acidimicrobiales bacterium]|nr:NAD(P)H-dependent oxidoreductase [Acidimicrobiales bacterium]
MTRVAVVVGNPKPASRTLAAATLLAGAVAGVEPATVLDVVTLGAGLLGFGDPAVARAVDEVRAAELLVVASPTYKATYTGVLKAFLDQVPADGLAGVVAVPLMVGAGPGHALAPELSLKPVLVELGATCPTRACYVLERDHLDPEAYAAWVERARPQLLAALAGRA